MRLVDAARADPHVSAHNLGPACTFASGVARQRADRRGYPLLSSTLADEVLDRTAQASVEDKAVGW